MSKGLQKQWIEPDTVDEYVATNSLRVLIIDDDPAYQHLCRRFLAQDAHSSFEVVAVSEGKSGLEKALTQRFDCLLVDYSLPDISGTQFIQNLKNQLGNQTPPTIVLTALGGETAAAEAIRAGATDFLSKAVVSSESLSRSINNAVEKGRLKRSIYIHSKQLQQANQSLQMKNDEIQRFYQNVSHEVKTPLAATREFIAIVLDGIMGEVTEGQKEMLIHALESCDQISEHFNNLIDMTRLEAGKITLNKQHSSIDAILTRCLAAAVATANAKKISIKQEIEQNLPDINCDRNRIIQVLSNLLGNAIKYTRSEGSVMVSIKYKAAAKRLQISVSDNGCGISDADLGRIFDRLYQVKNGLDDSVGGSLGLGLSIAKEIVMLHDGDIWAESVVNKGSKFTFELPVTDFPASHNNRQNTKRFSYENRFTH